jgi:NADH:ubiquinone oxidoreductase subunit 4 (subunit M)
MAILVVLLAGLFLPLFPLSMLFNLMYARIRNPVLRGILLLVWPQIGLTIIFGFGLTHFESGSNWILTWALLTSLLYALRAVALREVGLWTSFVGTSAWALLWILVLLGNGGNDGNGADSFQLALLSLGISVPLVLMALLGAVLEQRFGAAYLGLYGGLAQSIPRFTGVLVVVVLAIVATPVFPAFFAMLSMMIQSTPVTPFIAIGVGLVWLLWSWAGARLLQGLIVGPKHNAVVDLSVSNMWLYIAVLVGLMFTGVYWVGVMS